MLKSDFSPDSGRNLGNGGFLSRLKCLGSNNTIVRSGQQMAAAAKQIIDGAVGGQEVLGLSCGFEAAHLPLFLPGGAGAILPLDCSALCADDARRQA